MWNYISRNKDFIPTLTKQNFPLVYRKTRGIKSALVHDPVVFLYKAYHSPKEKEGRDRSKREFSWCD